MYYLFSARNIVTDKGKTSFGNEPGQVQYLKIQETGTDYSPAQTIPKDNWIKDLVSDARKNSVPAGSTDPGILIFIHGYNNSRSVVLERHRLLANGLQKAGYNGIVVSFDWPSADQALNYLEDRHDAKATSLFLVNGGIIPLVNQLIHGCSMPIHLLAHSTGAFVIREAFDDAEDTASAGLVSWTVGQIAFIGGDISSDSMSNGRGSVIFRHCQRLTNYYNEVDVALNISNIKRLGVAARVGRVGLPETTGTTKSVNVNCTSLYQSMSDSEKSKINGLSSHAFYFYVPAFYKDLASVLSGDSRKYITNRVAITNGFSIKPS
jgi:esterase/lipase superfamily enzyme